MRKIFAVITMGLMGFASCSKDDSPKPPIDPVVDVFTGTWSLDNIEGLESIQMEKGADPFIDSIVFTGDQHYLFIKNGDTTDAGEYLMGHGEAMNGFGRLQAYDSIVYHSTINLGQTHVLNAPPPLVQFFKLENDRLKISDSYFKDSASTKLIANYIQK